MDSDRWERVKELFEAVLERDEPERSAFLLQACPNDEALRLEVESLVSGHNRAGHFMQTGAASLQAAAALTANTASTFSPGEIISHRFKVLRSIGRGGMGEVYEALDLDRDVRVALKTILPEIAADPKTLARFRQEIELALRVAHRNVCRVHDLERHQPFPGSGKPEVVFLTMELLDGKTLAERLRRQGRMVGDGALPLIRQMADGLAAAHKVGVIHCDFKPGNVMLVSEGPADVDSEPTTEFAGQAKVARAGSAASDALRVVITDFGLARAMRPTVTRETIEKSLSTSRQLLGTLLYMAPEQLEGCAASPATDVYALGLVAYEMVTGRQPFSGPTPLAAAYQRLSQSPPPPRSLAPDLDPALESVILRCLKREVGARYANASTTASALALKRQPDSLPIEAVGRVGRWVMAPWFAGRTRVILAILAFTLLLAAAGILFMPNRGVQPIDSVAVLPFSNLSGTSDSEYLADGITEGIIDSLAKLANLRVVSRFSVFQYKGHDLDPRAVGKRLGAAALVMGRLKNRGGKLIIEAELVDARKDSQIWGERYDIGVVEASAVSEEIASAIANKLRLRLSASDKTRLSESYTNNQTAFKNYLLGRYFWNKRDKEDIQRGIGYFNKAIEVDPGYAAAYAGLADSYTVLADFRYEAPKDAFPKARTAALKALQLNDTLAEAHASLGYVEALHDWNWTAAENELRRAITLSPNYAPAHLYNGIHLAEMGRLDEGLAEIKRAQELDPLSLIINTDVGTILYYTAADEASINQLNKTLEMDPNFLAARFALATVYAHQGRDQEAVENYLAAGTLYGESTQTITTLRKAYEISGWTGFLHAWLRHLLAESQTTYVAPYAVAEVYAHLGSRNEVFQWLEKAYEERSSEILSIKVDPDFKDFRNDPRFKDLLQRLGLG